MGILEFLTPALCLLPLIFAFGAYISTREAANRTGLDQRHISRLVKEKKIEGEKFGHIYMVDEESLNTYMANRPKPGPVPGSGRSKKTPCS